MKIKPLFDRILVEVITTKEEQKQSMLVLPESSQEKPLVGKIIASGDGKMADGEETKMQVSVGDKILFNKYSGNTLKENGHTLILLRQSEILAVIEMEEK